jgi:hypothetical protein
MRPPINSNQKAKRAAKKTPSTQPTRKHGGVGVNNKVADCHHLSNTLNNCPSVLIYNIDRIIRTILEANAHKTTLPVTLNVTNILTGTNVCTIRIHSISIHIHSIHNHIDYECTIKINKTLWKFSFQVTSQTQTILDPTNSTITIENVKIVNSSQHCEKETPYYVSKNRLTLNNVDLTPDRFRRSPSSRKLFSSRSSRVTSTPTPIP